jgi:flagellar motor switch protein FliG
MGGIALGAKKLTQLEKAAVLMLGFGEEITGGLFKHLSTSEMKRIGGSMSRLGRLDQQIVDEVMAEFYDILQMSQVSYYGGNDFTRKVLDRAFGERGAEEIALEVITPYATMDALELIDAEGLARLIRNEHPQTLALILAHCDPKKCAQVLKLLPESLHAELLIRISNLESVAPEVIEEIDDFLRKEIEKMGSWNQKKLGGAQKAAAIIAAMGKGAGQDILENLEAREPDLGEEIRSLMFTFEDLVKLNDKGMQALLQTVKQDLLIVALKTAPEDLLQLVLKNMSERAGKTLREDLEQAPKTKLSDVQEAQRQILSIVEGLIEQGTAIIDTDDDQYV